MVNSYEWCAEGVSSHMHDLREYPFRDLPLADVNDRKWGDHQHL